MRFLKDGVKTDVFRPVLLEGLLIADRELWRFGYDLVVTEIWRDGVGHMEGSLHYKGYAADLRSRDMKVQDVPLVVRQLSIALGRDWQVVQEKDHIHMEYDPQHDGGKTLP